MNCTRQQDHKKSRPAYHEIAIEAYCLWEAAGRPEGRAMEHWLTAEQFLRAGAAGGPEARASCAADDKPPNARARELRYGLVLPLRSHPISH